MKTCEHPPETPPAPVKALSLVFAMTGTFFLFELFGGWWAGSLALIADAMHMGVDLIALGMTLFAAVMSRRPPDAKRTFGYKRLEVLAAMANGAALWVATGIILREAYARLEFPLPVAAPQMLAIAAAGLICNSISGAILYSSSRKNINMRGAFLHVMSDTAGSLTAMISAVVIMRTRWYQADAIASVAICVGIVLTSYWLLRDSIHILLEGAPAHLDLEKIRQALEGLSGVKEVHDLHLWSLTQGSESMSGHLVVEAGRDSADVLREAAVSLKENFGLSHVTLQIEK